jgi:hypothetical protein
MEILLYALIAVAGLVILWFVFRRVAGCLIKVLIVLAVLAAIAFILWRLAVR